MNKIKLMTSYMVYRELFKNNRKDHYEILSLFIEHLINNNKLDVKFSDVDIKELLFNEFGFDIPVSAIKISLSRISKNNLKGHKQNRSHFFQLKKRWRFLIVLQKLNLFLRIRFQKDQRQ